MTFQCFHAIYPFHFLITNFLFLVNATRFEEEYARRALFFSSPRYFPICCNVYNSWCGLGYVRKKQEQRTLNICMTEVVR